MEFTKLLHVVLNIKFCSVLFIVPSFRYPSPLHCFLVIDVSSVVLAIFTCGLKKITILLAPNLKLYSEIHITQKVEINLEINLPNKKPFYEFQREKKM
jgi:hypothetical protein